MSEADRERWNVKYREGSHTSLAPSPFLVSLATRLPRAGRALDVASGIGRNALWLAAHGLEVTLVDISEVALEMARERAEAAQLTIHTVRLDLETEPLPAGPWDAVVSILYLQRSLFKVFPTLLRPGGLLVYLQPTVVSLERNAKPRRDHLLEPGELAGLVRGLDVLTLDESWSADGYHEARLLARKGAG